MNKRTVTAGIIAMVVGLFSFSSIAQADYFYGGHGATYGHSGTYRGYGGYRYGHRTPARFYRNFYRYGRTSHTVYHHGVGHRGVRYGYGHRRHRIYGHHW